MVFLGLIKDFKTAWKCSFHRIGLGGAYFVRPSFFGLYSLKINVLYLVECSFLTANEANTVGCT